MEEDIVGVPHTERIAQAMESAEKGEVLILSDLAVGEKFIVRTVNSIYSLKKLAAHRRFTIQGGSRWQEPTDVTISGSTWGGSMLLIERVALGMRMEIWRENDPDPVVTSPVESWSIVKE